MESCTSRRVRSRNHSPTREARRAVMEWSNLSMSDIDSISRMHCTQNTVGNNTVLHWLCTYGHPISSVSLHLTVMWHARSMESCMSRKKARCDWDCMRFGIPNHIPLLNHNPPSRDVIGYAKTHTIPITTRLAGMWLYDCMYIGIPNHIPLTCTWFDMGINMQLHALWLDYSLVTVMWHARTYKNGMLASLELGAEVDSNSREFPYKQRQQTGRV